MTRNRIKQRLTEKSLSQADLARAMPDGIGTVGVSYLTTGKVLPTVEGMRIMCDILECSPTELYDLRDLTYSQIWQEEELPSASINTPSKQSGSRNHKGMREFRSWLTEAEAETLENAVNGLGYRNLAEWLREMIRDTNERNRLLHR